MTWERLRGRLPFRGSNPTGQAGFGRERGVQAPGARHRAVSTPWRIRVPSVGVWVALVSLAVFAVLVALAVRWVLG